MARRNLTTKKTATGEAEWEPLYALADRIFALQPWEFLPEECLFGVQNPQTQEIDYVCVMGELGQHRALAFYRGSDGLNGLLKMRLAGDPSEYAPTEALSWQNCLMLAFEDRDEVSQTQRARIKALGRAYRGRSVWPNFQSFVPHRLPWEIEPEERPWMRIALEQALDVLERVREEPAILPDIQPLGPHLVRVRGEDEAWQDALLPVAPRTTPALSPTPLDPALVAALLGNGRVRNRLEMGCLPVPEPVQEAPDRAPYFAYTLIVVEPNSGMVLGTDIAAYEALPDAAVNTLTRLFQSQRILPAEVAVESLLLYRLLKPLADTLEFSLTVPETLPGFEDAAHSLLSFMGGFD